MSVIGFDIGNESCVIAAAKRGGIDVLLNDEAKRETPAVVAFGEKQRFLGSAGAAFATANPKSTISQIKRFIGKLYKEVQEELKLLPFVTREGPRGGILIELEYLKKKWTFTPVEILGMLFKHLKQIAEKNLESPVADCVIGIPSYFTDLQRRIYLDAALIAGLKPLRLMHDCTAIALGYGLYKTDFSDSGPTIVMFVDIGHCDTQVTVAAFEQGKMKILSHSFDQNLGGRDFDEVLFKHFAAQFKEKYKIDVYSNARASVRLRSSCEKVKKVLSANAEAPISIECLIGDTDVKGFITREEFENLSLELLERVTLPCIMALGDSGLSVDKIYTIELVGSGSRIPAIMRKLTSLFKREPTRTINASECVARGCALHCAMLSPTQRVRYEVQDIFSYSIGFSYSKKDKPRELTLFSQGSPIPSNKLFNYHGSTTFNFLVFYTNKTDFPAGISREVGHFVVCPPQNSGAERMTTEIEMKLNEHGIVELKSAKLVEVTRKNARLHSQKTVANSHMSNDAAGHKFANSSQYSSNYDDEMRKGQARRPNLESSGNLDVATTEDELHEAKEKEKMLAEQDIKVEEIKDQRNTLESFVYDTRSKLSSAYRSFATDSDKERLAKRLQDTEDWLYEDSDDESEQDYTEKLEDLKKLLDPIVKRYENEKNKTPVTKKLLTLIEEYRLAADLIPPSQKEEVKNECNKAEQWLHHNQQLEILKQVGPINWPAAIQTAMNFLKSNCKHIMRSKPSYPKHDDPVYLDQSDQPGDLNQSDQPAELNHGGQPEDSNQSDQPVDSNQSDQPADSNQSDQHMDLDQKEHHDCMLID